MRGEETRRRIVEEALRLFQEKGLFETSMAEIEKAAGVSKGGLYFHFESKEALALEALRLARETFKSFLDRAFSEAPPRKALRRFLEMIYEKLAQEGFRTGCLFGNTAIEVANRESPIRDFIEETFEDWKEDLATVLFQARNRGCLSNKEDPEALALFIIAALEGAILLSRLKKDGEPLRTAIRVLETLIPLKDGGAP